MRLEVLSPRFVTLLTAICTAHAFASSASASYIYIDYYAGPTAPQSTPGTVWSPALWGWDDLNAGAAGGGVVNPINNGTNAWRIVDSLSTIPNPAYASDLSARADDDAARHGWRLAANARYVDDFGAGANLGLSAFIAGRAYHLMLDLTPVGDLQATLHDESPRVHQLTTGGSGATALHRFELQNSPGSGIVALKVDGQTIDSAWDGVALPHDPAVQWGGSDQAAHNRGVMDFQEVVFQIGPFAAPTGDFDADGDVDGRDFLAWQQTLGSAFDRTADANFDGRVDGGDLAVWRQSFTNGSASSGSVPEPTPLLLTALAGLIGRLRFSRR